MVKLEATLSYQENCDYLPSSIIKMLDIEKQEVDVETIITIKNYDNRQLTPMGYKEERYCNNESSHLSNYPFFPYYNDELLLEAKINFTYEDISYPIRYKDINIYFFEEFEDRTKLNPEDSEHIIARNTELDEEGKVGVNYLPHNSGYFVVEYNETKFFKRKVVEHKVNLYPIPTKTIIKPVMESDALPLFVHFNESIDIMASVRDTYGKPPKDGAITFLSYNEKYDENDEFYSGNERVIGNPIILENGETTCYEPPELIINDDKLNYPIAPMGDIIEGPINYNDDWVHYVYVDEDYNAAIVAVIDISPNIDYSGEIIINGEPRFRIPSENIHDDFIVAITADYDIKDNNKIYFDESIIDDMEYFPLVTDGKRIFKLPEKYIQIGTYYVRVENNTTEEAIEFIYTINSINRQTYQPASGFISYSPIQYTYPNEENYDIKLIREQTEYIKAVYNYDNINYGESWKYYSQSMSRTKINVLIPGYINVAIRKNNANAADSWLMREDGLYELEKTDTLIAYAKLIDYKNNNANLVNNESYDVKFKIKGTTWAKNNELAQYIEHIYDGIPAQRTTENNETLFKLTLPINNKFNSYYDYQDKNSGQYKSLDPGIYSIEAYYVFNGEGNGENKPFYDSLQSDRVYFEIIGESGGTIIDNPEIPDEPDEPDTPIIDNPVVKINNINKIQPIFKGNIDIEIEVNDFIDSTGVRTFLSRYYNGTWENEIQIDQRTVNYDNHIFTINKNTPTAGHYKVITRCISSESYDEKEFDIDKASLIEVKETNSVTTGINQTIGVTVTSNGNIENILEDLTHIVKKVTHTVLMDKWVDINPIRSCTEETKIRETGVGFNLIRLENNQLILDAYHLDSYDRQGNTGCSTWLSFFDGCASINYSWKCENEWEVSFNVYSGNMSIGNSGAIFIVDKIPNYLGPYNLGQFDCKNPYHEDNEDWPMINNIEINSNGNIYSHIGEEGNRTKTLVTAYHPENQYGGVLKPHYFNDGMDVTLRYGDKLYTCQECKYEVNREFNICPVCGSKNIKYEKGKFYTILQETNGQSDFFNFTYDGFNPRSHLALVIWNYGGMNHGNGLTVKDVNIIHQEFLENVNIQFIGDNKAYITGTTNIIENKEYEFKPLYDGDDNYYPLQTATYDIKIKGNTQKGSLDIIDSNKFRIHYKGYNSQIIIGVLQAKNATKEIRIPIITNMGGYFEINDTQIENWESYVEFNLFKNPIDPDLLDIMDNTSIDDVEYDIKDYYENAIWDSHNDRYYEALQGETSNIYILYNQYLENERKVLFTTYNDSVIY